MFRRVNREEVAARNPLTTLSRSDERSRAWTVYEEYEFKTSDDGPYVTAKGMKARKTYEPLVDSPHLFLDFARLHERKDPLALFDWLFEHGLLGLHASRARRFRPADGVTVDGYDDKGGPTETVGKQLYEAKMANHALCLYEAALSRDEAKLEKLIVSEEYWGDEFVQFLLELRAKRTGADRVDVLVEAAAFALWVQVDEVLNAFAYPVVTFEQSTDVLVFSKTSGLGSLTASVWPRNLLGAMYLQFYWLITSGGDLTRCRFCNRIVSLGPSAQGNKGRKVRTDKQFCDNRCRQNHHYQTKLKPARKRNEKS